VIGQFENRAKSVFGFLIPKLIIFASQRMQNRKIAFYRSAPIFTPGVRLMDNAYFSTNLLA
jgi:hypothetical protein